MAMLDCRTVDCVAAKGQGCPRSARNPRREGPTAVRAGLLAFGSTDVIAPSHFDLPRDWTKRNNGRMRTIVPDNSGGTAVDLHHLPF